jgi:hypothetical protein
MIYKAFEETHNRQNTSITGLIEGRERKNRAMS